MDEPPRMIGYTRVSTEEQGRSGLGLAAQAEALRVEAGRRGWALLRLETDAGVSAVARRRPALERALDALRSGEADGIVVAKLDRLGRSVLAVAGLMAEAERRGWRLVALDVGVDTATPAGRMLAHVLAALAEWERDVIRQRTRDALAQARARGVRLGRERSVPAEVVERIAREHAAGAKLQAIADRLNADGVLGGHGGRWYPATVKRMLERAAEGVAA